MDAMKANKVMKIYVKPTTKTAIADSPVFGCPIVGGQGSVLKRRASRKGREEGDHQQNVRDEKPKDGGEGLRCGLPEEAGDLRQNARDEDPKDGREGLRGCLPEEQHLEIFGKMGVVKDGREGLRVASLKNITQEFFEK